MHDNNDNALIESLLISQKPLALLWTKETKTEK